MGVVYPRLPQDLRKKLLLSRPPIKIEAFWSSLPCVVVMGLLTESKKQAELPRVEIL